MDMSFQGTAGRWDGLHFAAGEPPHPQKRKPRQAETFLLMRSDPFRFLLTLP